MMLFGNAERPVPLVAAVNGSHTVVPAPLKSPVRSADVGALHKAEAASRRVVHPQSPKKNSLLRMMRPPYMAPNWFCTFFGARFGSPVREFRQGK